MTHLTARLMKFADAAYLAPRLRQADLDDLQVHRARPLDALSHPITAGGEAFVVEDQGVPIGAGGWTAEGAVWTLWVDLTRAQSRALLKVAPAWARILAIRSARPLSNFFLEGNRVTEGWLRATGCVDIHPEGVLTWQDRRYIPFNLKPLELLPYV